MGGGEGLCPQRADLYSSSRLLGPEQLLYLVAPVPPVPLPEGGAGGVDGGPRLFGEHPQAADVVAVLVGEQNGGQLEGLDPQLRQSGRNPLGGDAGVQQDMGIAAGDQGGVPQGAAGQGGKFQQGGPPFSLSSI